MVKIVNANRRTKRFHNTQSSQRIEPTHECMWLQITTPALTTSNLIKWVSAQQQQKPNTRCIFSVQWHYYSIALGCDARNAYKTMQNALYHGIKFPRAWTWERERRTQGMMNVSSLPNGKSAPRIMWITWLDECVCVCVHGLVSLPLKNEQEKTFRIRNSIA